MNWNTGLLLDYNTSIFKSIDIGVYYVIISCDLKKLQMDCQDLGLLIKLVDSYDYEAFDLGKKERFEPFRSKQRQEIIE